MRLLQKLRKSPAVKRGFTLVEMLVVAPLVLIVLAGLIAAIVGMIGDSLAASGRTTLSYSMQDSLDRIEQDSRLAINYLGNINYFTAPQGRNGDATAFDYTSNEDLILTQQSTTASPYDASRLLVYYANQPTACPVGGNAIGNRVLTSRVVYFLRNGSLWRRTIVNPWNTNGTPDSNTVCNAPWQRDTCPLGSTVGSGPTYTCNGIDEELLTDVTDFTPTFYKADGSSTTNPSLATIVRVSITVTKNISGESVTQTSTIRATRRNDVPATPVPDAPAVSVYNPTIDTYNNPILVSFQWSSSNATSYSYQTSTDGTNWTAATPTSSTYASVNVDYAERLAYIRVTAYNDQGSSTVTQFQSESVKWASCSLQNGWQNYVDVTGGGYARAAYTMTSAKMVVMKGLVTGAPTGASVICNLPSGFRPTKSIMHTSTVDASQFNGAPARIDVYNNGNVYTNTHPTTGWLSLDRVRFMAPDAAITWTTPSSPYLNSWQVYGGDWQPLRYGIDVAGRVQVEGLLTPGTQTNLTSILSLPVGYSPSHYLHFPAISNSTVSAYGYDSNTYAMSYNAIGVDRAAGNHDLHAKGYTGGTWETAQMMFFPNTFSGWDTSPPFLNSWQNYNSTIYAPFGFTKASDNMVSLRGLVKNDGFPSGRCPVLQPIANLPAGYRPAEKLIFLTNTNGYFGRVDVWPSGNIYCVSSYGGHTALESISFLADQP